MDLTESQYTESSERPWPVARPRSRGFFGSPICPDLDGLNADVAFLGVPFDQGTFGRPGARYGPDAVRDAPRAYAYNDPYADQEDAGGYFDLDVGGELLKGVTMADCGDVTILPADVLRNFSKVTAAVEKMVERGSFPVVVGGDHSITFPVVRALGAFAPLDIVHFDAHLDYTHETQGVLYSHGSPIRRCRELPFIDHITSLGVRSVRRKPYEDSQRDGSLVISTKRFKALGAQGVADLIPSGKNLYITFDVDVMDPAQAPGTGTPEVGGLLYHEAKDCLTELVRRNKVVGLDMVELAPVYDSTDTTSQLVARLITDVLSARFPAS